MKTRLVSLAENKKILIVAYHFPPDAAVGALRPQKFVKYLPEFGWQPYVLTIREKYLGRSDQVRLEDVTGVEIHRTAFWRTPLQVYLDVRDRFIGKKTATIAGISTIEASKVSVSSGETLRARFKRYLASFNWFPDDKLYWAIPAVFAGYRLIRREKIPAIYATCPPHTVALIGFLLSLLTGATLVIDFRDPWVLFRSGCHEATRCQLYDYLEERMERSVVRRAQAVVCTSERMTAAMREKYPAEPADKFVTILNGYDAGDMDSEAVVHRDDGTYLITYLGTFYLDRNPESFLRALRRAINEGIMPAKGIEVRFIGAVNAACGKPLEAMLMEYDLAEIVTVVPPIPHREAIRQMHEADLLLLLAPNQEYQIPGKALEYIGTQRPILALTGEGATADLIRTVNAGLVVGQDDADGIYRALVSMYQQHQGNEQPWYGTCDMAQYERKQLTRNLANILNKIHVITT